MTGKYLIYIDEANAWAKAEEEGRVQCPTGWNTDDGAKYMSEPEKTDAGTYALEVSNYETLTADELENIVTEVLFTSELPPDEVSFDD